MAAPPTTRRFPVRRDFVLLLIATFGAFVNYAVLLTVVPMWAVTGGAGAAGAGATTGVFMAVTVATQLAVPWLLRTIGYRWALTGGILLLGAPAAGYALSATLPVLIAVSAVRGVGFGLVTVAGAGLVPHLLPRWAHGRGAGLYGLSIGAPNLLALPAGVWATGRIGFPALFWLLTAVPVAGGLAALAITTGRTTEATPASPAAPAGLRRAAALRPLAAPWLLLWTSAIIAGALLTFLPIAVTGAAAGVVPVALLAYSAGTVVSRWGAGVVTDRKGTPRTLPAAMLSAVLGAAALAAATAVGGGWAVPATVAGALVVGLGFGAVQNDTLVLMFASGSGYGLASAVWNTAFDAGTGAAAVAVGLIVAHLGYPAGFGACGAAALACLPLVVFTRRKSDSV